MGSSKFDPQSFFRQVESVALHVPVSEIFGLFRRTLDLPGSWAALVTKKSGDSNVVRAGGVVMLMTPEYAFAPYRADPGPRTISRVPMSSSEMDIAFHS